MSRLFVYGTLRDGALVERLLGRRLAARPAMLEGFRRSVDPVIGYAVVHPRAGSRVDGQVLEDVDDAALTALDAYEGAQYRRAVVTVATSGGRRVEAFVYVPVRSPRPSPARRAGAT